MMQYLSLSQLLKDGCQDEEIVKAAARRESTPDELLGEATRKGTMGIQQPGADHELEQLLEQNETAKDAVIHVLLRAKSDPLGLGYYIGPGSLSFDKLVRAAALLTGEAEPTLRARLAGGGS